MQTNIVKAVGGQLYVCPTYVANSGATVLCSGIDTNSNYVDFTITDAIALTNITYGGANWYSGSKIMFTGIITGNKGGSPEVVFASAPGVLLANMDTTNKKLQIRVDYKGIGNYFQSSGTNLTWSDMSVMMYQINNSGTLYPIGIYIKAYGNDNKNSYIDIYGGTSATTSARLGLVNGVPAMANGTTPTGWGIYTNNGYFDGTIVSNSGTIGNFTLGDDLRSGTWGTSGSVLVSPGYSPSNADSVSIGGSAATGNTWAFTAGNNFGVTTAGALYASSANISGTISAGANSTIGPWSVTATSIYKGNATMGSATTGAAYFGDNGLSITDKFKVTAAGLLSATGADISGEIHASSGSTFGDTTKSYLSIGDSALDMYYNTNSIMHLGYGQGTGENGQTIYAPFFTMGDRASSAPIGRYSFTAGTLLAATGFSSTSFGCRSGSSGTASFSCGFGTSALSDYAFAEGRATVAKRIASHAEGYGTIAGAENSYVKFGFINQSYPSRSYGQYVETLSGYNHAEGYNTQAYGEAAHSEGFSSKAYGDYSHAEGNSNAYANYSHAEGRSSAYGVYSHTSGLLTVATAQAQTVIGKYNIYTEIDTDPDDGSMIDPSIFDAGDYAFIIGNGTADDARSNALTVDWSGNLITAGDITANGSQVLTQADVVNNLTSTSTTAPLSAAQGKNIIDYVNGWRIHFQQVGSATATPLVVTLPAASSYLMITGHNSTAALNSIWIIRAGGSRAHRVACGASTCNVTVTFTNSTTLSIKTTDGGTANIYILRLD